jgi:hypothetical protein
MLAKGRGYFYNRAFFILEPLCSLKNKEFWIEEIVERNSFHRS